jgi:hypothetical protein
MASGYSRVTRQQSTFACCWLPLLSCLLSTATDARCAAASKVPLPFVGYARKGTRGGKSTTQLMPGALQQPLLVATCACDLATQLMPAAQLPAKYL